MQETIQQLRALIAEKTDACVTHEDHTLLSEAKQIVRQYETEVAASLAKDAFSHSLKSIESVIARVKRSHRMIQRSTELLGKPPQLMTWGFLLAGASHMSRAPSSPVCTN
jgi:hypothetical protein